MPSVGLLSSKSCGLNQGTSDLLMLPHPPCPLTVVRLDSEELLLASSGVAVVIHLYYHFTLKSIEFVSVLAFSWLSLLESAVVFFLCHIIRSVHAVVLLAVVHLASVHGPYSMGCGFFQFCFCGSGFCETYRV